MNVNKKIKMLEKKVKKLEREIRALKHDHLTGLGNRHKLSDTLQFLYSEDNPKTSYRICMIDVNCLHEINRQLSYNAGDVIIKYVAEKIKTKCNNTSALAFRIGGDEFVIIMHSYDELCFKDIKYITYSCVEFNPKKDSFRKIMDEIDEKIKENKKKGKVCKIGEIQKSIENGELKLYAEMLDV